jgi:hypothetical protein
MGVKLQGVVIRTKIVISKLAGGIIAVVRSPRMPSIELEIKLKSNYSQNY